MAAAPGASGVSSNATATPVKTTPIWTNSPYTTTGYNPVPPPDSGNPYQLAAWAFDNAWLVAQSKATASDNLFLKAQEAAKAPAITPRALNFTPNVDEPNVYIPYMAEGASIARFYELSQAVIAQMADLYRGWIDEFAPNECEYLQKAQAWICDTLTNGGTGMNRNVEDQIWQRDRNRLNAEYRRAERESIAMWAARGYPLPPGAAAYQVLELRKAVAEKTTQASRDVAIKQAEIEIENVRFAVENATKLYSTLMGTAADYLKALAVGPTSAMQVVPSVTDSQSKLIGAANEYYRSRISVEELRLKASMPSAEWDQQARIRNADMVMEEIKSRVAAATASAQSLGTQAAAALNSLHVSAGVSAGTHNGVSYSYSNDTIDAAPTVTSIGG